MGQNECLSDGETLCALGRNDVGKRKYRQAFIGILFGKVALKGLLKDDRQLTRNTPTIPEFKIKGSGDFSVEKKKWIALMEEHAQDSNPEIMHPFFGKMTKEQIGQMVYKHTDHHLRQFEHPGI